MKPTFASLRSRLAGKIHGDDIQELAYYAQGADDEPVKQALYRLLFDEDKQVADNAAWVFAHFDLYSNRWLYSKHHELIDEVLRTPDETKRRLLLTLLLRQPFSEAGLRTDFLDFCLQRMMAVGEPVGVRCLCIKLAYEQCRFFPELCSELRAMLEMMEADQLSAGLRCTRKNVLKKLKDY